ncbi:unnamed protein product [Auanema sp. JU1783]|nr:unnamed protein product [Auanema sp. JU1783]
MSELRSTLGERIRLNVGGVIFETSVSTLSKFQPSFLSTIIEQRWKGEQQEIFIDRDPTHFPKVLNFLRDGIEFQPPKDPDSLEELRREAQFYGLTQLQTLCTTSELMVGDIIQWKHEAIPLYWRPFIRYLVDDSLSLPFIFDRNNHTLARCIACEEYQDPKCSYLFDINYLDWEPMKHHMTVMKGEITQLMGNHCCIIEWENGQSIHIPKSALRKVI